MRRALAGLTAVSLAGALLIACPVVSHADYTYNGTVLDCAGHGVPNVYVNVVMVANGASDCDSPGNSLLCVAMTNSSGQFSYVCHRSGSGYPTWCWNVYVSTPPIAGEQASDIPCCNGLNPAGGHITCVIADDSTTAGGTIILNYSGGCTQGGDPGEGERRPH